VTPLLAGFFGALVVRLGRAALPAADLRLNTAPARLEALVPLVFFVALFLAGLLIAI